MLLCLFLSNTGCDLDQWFTPVVLQKSCSFFPYYFSIRSNMFSSQRRYQTLLLVRAEKLGFVCGNAALNVLDAPNHRGGLFLIYLRRLQDLNSEFPFFPKGSELHQSMKPFLGLMNLTGLSTHTLFCICEDVWFSVQLRLVSFLTFLPGFRLG